MDVQADFEPQILAFACHYFDNVIFQERAAWKGVTCENAFD